MLITKRLEQLLFKIVVSIYCEPFEFRLQFKLAQANRTEGTWFFSSSILLWISSLVPIGWSSFSFLWYGNSFSFTLNFSWENCAIQVYQVERGSYLVVSKWPREILFTLRKLLFSLPTWVVFIKFQKYPSHENKIQLFTSKMGTAFFMYKVEVKKN